MSGIEWDFSEITKLAADLGEVPKNAGKRVRQAVEVSARKVKDSWRAPLQGSVISGAAASISYDIIGGEAISGSSITADIGPELGGPGSLVAATEEGFGGRQGPTGYGAAALQQNQAEFQKGLEIALEQAEREAGL